MPTDQPSNAFEDAIGSDARDDANAAAVLNDDMLDLPLDAAPDESRPSSQ